MTSPAARDRYGRYAVEIGGKNVAPSVSTVLGLLNKDGLSWGAAKETALFAIHHQDQWMHLHPDEAYHRLRQHHKGVWDNKAGIGTLAHSVAELWTAGEAVDLSSLVATSEPCKKRKWNEEEQSEVVTKLGGYVDALERFWSEQEPEFEQVERSVVCPGVDIEEGEYYGTKRWSSDVAYAGTFDARGRLKDGKDRRIDWKTGSRYPIETTLQLAAYDFAPYLGVYNDAGRLTDLEPNTRAEVCSIVYLHENGTYELLDLPVNEAAWERFIELRRMKSWLKDMDGWLKANPEPEREIVE